MVSLTVTGEDEPCNGRGVMPKNPRIHKVNVNSQASNLKKTDQSLPDAMQEAGGQGRSGECVLLSDVMIDAMFASCRTWLQMVQECNSEILKTYEGVFCNVSAIYAFPWELVQRSCALYFESVGRQSKAANLLVFRAERSKRGVWASVDSIETAMDVAIGADPEETHKAAIATAA